MFGGVKRAPTVLLMAVLLSSGLGAAAIDRVDSAVVQDEMQMQYHCVLGFSGQDAKNARSAYDLDLDGRINATEGARYVADAASARLDNRTSYLQWDGNPTYWVDVVASAPGVVSNTLSKSFSLVLDGTVNLTSAPSDRHTLTLSDVTGLASYGLSLTLPTNWSITSVTGINVSMRSQNTIEGNLSTNGVGVIQVQEAAPPSPFGNDTTPPVVYAGPDRTVVAGTLTGFDGSAADNDPSFPSTASFWWTFMYGGTLLNFSGKNLTFTFWALGVFTLTFSAVDGSGNEAQAALDVAVLSPDTRPPDVNPGPDASVAAGTPFVRTGTAVDNDPSFNASGRFWWTFLYNGTPENCSGPVLSFTFWRLGTTPLTLFAMDAWGNIANASMRLTVLSPDLTPPTVNAGPDRSSLAGTPTTLAGSAADNDPAFLENGSFWWTFIYNGTQWNLSGLRTTFTFWALGDYRVVFTAVDPWGNRNEDALQLAIVSPDTTPPVVDAGADDRVPAGYSVPLNGSASDNDPGFAVNGVYWWAFRYGDANVTRDGREASFRFDLPGTYTVTLFAQDGWGNIGSDSRIVTVDAPLTSTPGNGGTTNPLTPAASLAGFDLLMPGLLLAIGLASLGGVTVMRRRAATQGEAAEGPSAAPPRSQTVAAAQPGPAYAIEGLLVLYKDGRLIHHQAVGRESIFESPEVVGAMFTAVTQFIRDSFRQEGALSKLTYGQNTIVLERSAYLFGAAIVFGEPDARLAEELREALGRIEFAYASVIERWYGDRDAFKGIEGFVAPVVATTAGVTRAQVRAAARDQTVKLLSGTEHYKGYLRLRLAIANQTDSKITDVKITALFNQSVLRLARVEPSGVPQEGSSLHLGEVEAGERVGALFYLDPQTCSLTNIEGTATYRDALGENREIRMKPRLAEVICPLFFTPGHANPATMRRLVATSLAVRDSKLFRVLSLPAGAGYADVFEVARDAVSRHHVLLVRNIATKAPFLGKSWFYGEAKESKSPVIIRVAVSEERKMVEFFGAVESASALTGLLAEFNRSFSEMMRDRLPGVRFEPVLDDALKGLMAAEEFDAPPTEGRRA